MSIKLTTLKNGLRVITDHVPAVDSVALGVWAGVGTRNENLAHNGVAHMVEHMLFKGTARRNAARIAEEIEDVGGQVNAYTSREVTAYHIHLLKEDTGLALDVLSDIVQHSALPEDEVARERQVILQEIGMTADTPDDLVFDHYQETAYPGQALGAPILGRADIVGGMERDVMRDYINRYYTPGRLVVSAAGNVDHDAFARQVENLFDALPPDQDETFAPAAYQGGSLCSEKALEQSHVVLGFRGASRMSPDYEATMVLSTVLGGGMSSRLFQEIREKRGLVYAVFSYHGAYQDDGQFVVYAGTGPDSLSELVPVLCAELLKSESGVTEQEIARAKAQLRAGILMGRESMMTRAGQQAKHLIHYGKVVDIPERLRRLEAVTVKDVQRVARDIFRSKPTLSALGPLGQLESYEQISARLAA